MEAINYNKDNEYWLKKAQYLALFDFNYVLPRVKQTPQCCF